MAFPSTMKSLVALAFFLVVGAERRVRSRDHPVSKVIKMLEGLADKVQFEGKMEQKSFDKYEKWCFDSKKTLNKAIEEQEEKINMLLSDNSAKTKENATLTRQIDELADTMAKLETAGIKAQQNRDDGAKLFKQVSEDLDATIAAFKTAIETLEGAKDGGSLVQVMRKPAVKEALALVDASKTDPMTRKVLMAIQQDPEEGKERPEFKAEGDYEDHIQTYDFKSDNVIELLKGLKDKFVKDLTTAKTEEENAKNSFELAKQAREGESKAASDSKDEKTTMLATVQSELTQGETDLSSVRADNSADKATLKTTETSCQIKTREWEERSRVRGLELKAMKVAMEILSKATGVRTEAPVNPAAPTMPVADPVPDESLLQGKAASFMQLAEESGSQKRSLSFLQTVSDPRQRAVQLLRKAASVSHSHALERLAQELSIQSGGAFDQVINAIQKMLFHLMDEQRDEDKQKIWCDQEISKSNISKADKEEKVEELRLKIETEEGTVQRLVNEVKEAREMLNSITSFVAEATEIRAVGKKENALALSDSQKAQDAVAQATSVLESFYKDSGMMMKEAWELVQEPVELSDKPETWGSSYTGVSDPAAQPGGIVSVLQRIGSDFATMEADTRAQEQTDQMQFEEQMKDSTIEKARRTKAVELKEAEKKRLLDKVSELQKSRKHYVGELEAVNQYLKDLMPACVNGDSTYEERKEARKEEMDALSGAEQILKDAFENKTAEEKPAE